MRSASVLVLCLLIPLQAAAGIIRLKPAFSYQVPLASTILSPSGQIKANSHIQLVPSFEFIRDKFTTEISLGPDLNSFISRDTITETDAGGNVIGTYKTTTTKFNLSLPCEVLAGFVFYDNEGFRFQLKGGLLFDTFLFGTDRFTYNGRTRTQTRTLFTPGSFRPWFGISLRPVLDLDLSDHFLVSLEAPFHLAFRKGVNGTMMPASQIRFGLGAAIGWKI